MAALFSRELWFEAARLQWEDGDHDRRGKMTRAACPTRRPAVKAGPARRTGVRTVHGSQRRRHDVAQDSSRAGRRTDRGDQSIAGRRRAGGAALFRDHPRLRRGARRARNHRRGSRRPVAGDDRQSRGGRGDARRRARLDPRQAGPQVLPGDLQGPEGARDRHVLLHRRQRFLRHRAHRRRRGQEGRACAARDPHSQDDRQRSRRLRPHAGLSFGGALRRPGLHGRQSRQSGAQRRLLRGGHGPPRRLPHRGFRAGAPVFPATDRI